MATIRMNSHGKSKLPEARLIVGDLRDADSIHAVMKDARPDAVMHFAAYSLVGESVENPFKYMGDNVSNAANMLSAMLETGVDPDNEMIWPGSLAEGIDYVDLLAGMAPKPVMILAAENDFFPIEGARRTLEEVRQFIVIGNSLK